MPKNKSAHRGRHGCGGGGRGRPENREAAAHEDYAVVTRVFGGNRVEARCLDGLTRKIVIRGAVRRRAWILPNDVLIVELRHGMTNNDLVADVGQAPLSAEEVAALKARGALPDGFGAPRDAADDGFVFDRAGEGALWGDEEGDEEVDVSAL